MSLFQAFILGLIQGITEFLPISSSGHLVVLPWFFDWEDPGLTYSVFLHLGTLIAVFVYFSREWFALIKAGFLSIMERRIGFERERILFWYLVLATIPAVLAGLLLHEQAESSFRSPLMVAVSLAAVGFLLFWIDGRRPAVREMDEFRLGEAMWVGIAQAFAIFPGVSRSGATMTMARFLGFRREASARFSFLLAFPIILGASLYECKNLGTVIGDEISWGALIVGFGSSLFFGLASIHFLLQWLRTADFQWFAWYRLILAAVIVLASLLF